MIICDFKDDFKEFIKEEMELLGYQYESNQSLETNSISYFNLNRRLISKKNRQIHESKELEIPPEHIKEYNT